MNAITTTAPMWLAYAEMERLAVAIAKSGLFGIKTPEQAIVLMQIAQAEGRHPALAARDYDIIQGRPAKKAEAMHRDFLAGGGKVEWTTLTDDTADATFSHPQGGTARIIWDTDRAALAGLEKKENWKKYPRQMLRNRVVSEGVRTVWPLATSGMHLPEEMGDATSKPANDADFNGTTLEATPEREAINSEVPLKAAASDMKRADKITEKSQVYETTEDTNQKWLRNLETKLSMTQSQAEVVRISDLKSVKDAVQHAPAEIKQRVSELLADAYARFPEDDLSDEALGDVEIAGEEKIAAG
jgi:hypothetical protein